MGIQDQVKWHVPGMPSFMLIQSIDFSENYSPVVNNVTFCIMLLMVLHFGYSAKIVDVETDFLYGDLE